MNFLTTSLLKNKLKSHALALILIWASDNKLIMLFNRQISVIIYHLSLNFEWPGEWRFVSCFINGKIQVHLRFIRKLSFIVRDAIHYCYHQLWLCKTGDICEETYSLNIRWYFESGL